MKKLFYLLIFIFGLSIYSNATNHDVSSKASKFKMNYFSKKVSGTVYYTDACGNTWKIVATCSSCTTVSQFGDAVQSWINDNSNSAGCLTP